MLKVSVRCGDAVKNENMIHHDRIIKAGQRQELRVDHIVHALDKSR